MERPRLLLIPFLTELEWPIKPVLENWADVASYDAPGVGDEPPPRVYGWDAVVERGLAEIDARGWDRCVLVSDEYGSAVALRIARHRPEAVAGLALGHATLSFRKEGDRAPINVEVNAAVNQMLKVDYRTFMRNLGGLSRRSYSEEVVDGIMARVTAESALAYFRAEAGESGEWMRKTLVTLRAPLLFAEHVGCLRFTQEGFEDAVSEFPDALVVRCDSKPSTSPEFAAAIKELAGLAFGKPGVTAQVDG
jgi:pimeloyl-ACP methyl ester carboxylesterase